MATTIHNEVRRLRRDRDWTQAHLGGLVGVSRQTLIAIERGGTPSLATAFALARHLGTDIATMFPNHDIQPSE